MYLHRCPVHVQIGHAGKDLTRQAPPPPAQILVGNKCDVSEEKRAVAYSRGQALADEFGIQFFETSAKDNSNVEPVFVAVARDVMQRLQQEQADSAVSDAAEPLRLTTTFDQKQKTRSGCC